MSVIKEFREFYLRATQVNVGSKADQEVGFPVSYFVNGVSKFNRFLKGHFPSKDVMTKFLESITFKLNKEDRAQLTQQGLTVIATDANARSRTSNAIDGTTFTAVIVPHQLPEIIATLDVSSDVIIGSATSYKGIKLTAYTRTPVGGTIFRKVYAIENIGTRKFVKQVSTVGDGDIIVIPYTEISADGIFADGSLASGTTAKPKVDYNVTIWGLLDGTNWELIQYPTVISKSINNSTGDLSLNFNFAPTDDPLPYRIIITG